MYSCEICKVEKNNCEEIGRWGAGGKKNQSVFKKVILRKEIWGIEDLEIDSYKIMHSSVHFGMTLCFENAS